MDMEPHESQVGGHRGPEEAMFTRTGGNERAARKNVDLCFLFAIQT